MKTPLFSLLVLCALTGNAQNGLYPYSDGHRWGLTNENRDVIAPPQFDTSFSFSRVGYAVARKDGKYGTIDPSGKTMVAFSYDEVNAIGQELGSGRLAGKQVLLNLRTGKQLSPTPFDRLSTYCDCAQKLIIAIIGKKTVFVNTVTGKQLGKSSYDEAQFFSSFGPRALVKTGGKYGLINTETGAWVLPAKYDRLESSYLNGKNVIETAIGSIVAYKDADGKEIKAEPTKETGVEEGVISEVVRPVEDESENKGLFVYNLGNGSWKLTLESRGYGRTKVLQATELKGYSSVVKLFYNPYGGNKGGKLKAIKDGRAGIIDMNDKVLLPFQYDNIDYDNRNSLVITKLNGKTGVLLEDLTEIKKPVLKGVIETSYTFEAWLVEMPEGQKGYMNKKTGKIYIPGIAD